MKHLRFIGVFLVTILSTVSANKNVTIQLQHSNITANENEVANKTKREKYNAYVNAEVQEIWEQYLAEAGVTEFKPFQERERKNKLTTAIGKDTAVTEKIKAFRERGNNIGIEATPTSKFTPKQIGYQKTALIGRRQDSRKFTQGIDPQLGGIDKHLKNRYHKLQFEGFRQPYWEGGDYVFLRTGSPTTELADKDQVTNPMEAFRACDRTCNLYFKQYGKVCGHRFKTKTWKNEYKNFENICDIDHENCIHTNSRPNWHPMYRGTCGELLTFPEKEYENPGIKARGLEWAHFVYVPAPRTEPTTDSVDKEIAELLEQQKG